VRKTLKIRASLTQFTTHSEEDKVINTGVAAHITAASSGGPRYDPRLSVEARKSPSNGIWLCQPCAKLIDSDSPKYTIELLRTWKSTAEMGDEREAAKMAVFSKIEQMMPVLLEEMYKDPIEYPLKREFILMKKTWVYGMVGGYSPLAYYYEDHDDLDDKIAILCNYCLIRNITYNNTKRYKFTEDLVDYLTTRVS
jgi:hypothetical protein